VTDRINVTKTFLPPLNEYQAYLEGIWQRGQLTNQGTLLKQLQTELETYLQVEELHFVTNGTLALQIAMRALGIPEGEVITTPFSYVATTSAIMWEGCTPVYVDIDPQTLCIDPRKIVAAITPRTKAIMPVHVFGRPCEVQAIEAIAAAHGLKVIYDAAHAFGVQVAGQSIMRWGDISTCSFHATKLFHTIEGGGIVVNDRAAGKAVELTKRFGHEGDEHAMLGINAKASEFQAAMGLCNLKYIEQIIGRRKAVCEQYDAALAGSGLLIFPPMTGVKHNYAYYPILMESESQLLAMIERMAADNIYPRRYFYPSLNTLPYVAQAGECPVSEDIARRIMCLPLYTDLKQEDVERICKHLIT
jgi:dTDP-4-amino-4,6-dideoxygalactose transaminase